ncbi:MAG: alpha/beta hydrolase family protein [Sedimenticola sp.]|nr:alpha/beta hydrolase family protein [Sedimenticola sp.]
MRGLFLILFLLLPQLSAAASDLARERRIADQISEALLVGEPVTLQAGDTPFLAIHTRESTGYSHGAAIILHGRGAHPDWVDVVNPLRSELPEYGWQTLSIQLPVAAADASDWVYRELIPEAGPRIAAAVDYLKQQGVSNLVLVGHSLGARMGLEYLATGAPEELRAFVAVGLPADPQRPQEGALQALRQVKVPMLDIFGSRDLESVLGSARARSLAAREADLVDYRQTPVEGADHFFRGLSDTLVARVRAWLGRAAPGVRQPPAAPSSD